MVKPASQTQRILTALQQGERITPLDALDRFGCFRLSARIADIEKQGYRVNRKMIKLCNGNRFKEYWMER